VTDERITVWVQRFKDRQALMLQWLDPDTGRRKSKSAGTDDAKQAEIARADLETDLNHGRHKEASRMSWEKFRECRPPRLVFAELKRKGSWATPEQTQWLSMLRQIPAVEAHLWTPADFDRIVEILR
jgi:hypothetical protein